MSRPRIARFAGLIAGLVLLCLAACGGANPGGDSTEMTGAATSATLATPADETIAPPAADAPLIGPLAGFYIEDFYEDVYLSIYDVETGGLRVLHSGVPIYVGEAQWFDNGCRLFVHGQVTDLHGIPQWSIPQEAAERIINLNAARLSPDRKWIAHIVPSGIATGQGAITADVEVISLAPPYEAIRLTTRGGGDPRALAWSADGAWLYFVDHDENDLLQVYRATPGGPAVEQLTHHDDAVGAINGLSPSPDSRYLAYSVQNLLQSVHPYAYQPADEGWVGILDLQAGTSAVVRQTKFGGAEPERGLVWDHAGERLVIIGDSLPVAADDPAVGRQVYWVTATGEVTHTLLSADGPDGSGGRLGWIAPLGDIDMLLVGIRDEFYIYESGEFRQLAAGKAPALGMDIGRRPVGILPAPVGFPGEAACGEGQ